MGDLRVGTGVLLAASSVASSFPGERPAMAGGSIVGGAAIRAFARLAEASVVVRIPSSSHLHRRLAPGLHRCQDANHRRIKPFFVVFQAIYHALVAAIVRLLASVSGAPVQ